MRYSCGMKYGNSKYKSMNARMYNKREKLYFVKCKRKKEKILWF